MASFLQLALRQISLANLASFCQNFGGVAAIGQAAVPSLAISELIAALIKFSLLTSRICSFIRDERVRSVSLAPHRELGSQISAATALAVHSGPTREAAERS